MSRRRALLAAPLAFALAGASAPTRESVPASAPAPESAPASAPAETGPIAESAESAEAAGGPSELDKLLAGAGMTAPEPEAPPVPTLATFVGGARLWIGADTGWENAREDVFDWRLYLTGRVDFARGDFHARLEARFRYSVRTNERADREHVRYDTELRLGEAWVSHPLWRVELTLGLQRFRFGAADLFSPTDFVNPPDLREGFAVSELPTLPVFGLKARYHLAGFDFIVVLIPFHTPPRLDTIGSDYALLGPASIPDEPPDVGDELEAAIDNSIEPRFNDLALATELPDESPVNFQYVARVAGSHGGWDYGVTYGWVFARTPTYRVDPRLGTAVALARDDNPIVAAAGTLALFALVGEAARNETALFSSDFHREHHVTADVVTSLGPFTVKAEAGLVPAREVTSGDLASGMLVVENRSVFDAVAGADYARGDDLLITLELGWSNVLGDPVEGSLSFFYADSLRLSLLARWSLFDGDLALQALGYYDFLRRDWLAAPSVRWAIGDHFAVGAGAAILGGPPESLGGYFTENDLVYLEGELQF